MVIRGTFAQPVREHSILHVKIFGDKWFSLDSNLSVSGTLRFCIKTAWRLLTLHTHTHTHTHTYKQAHTHTHRQTHTHTFRVEVYGSDQ